MRKQVRRGEGNIPADRSTELQMVDTFCAVRGIKTVHMTPDQIPAMAGSRLMRTRSPRIDGRGGNCFRARG